MTGSATEIIEWLMQQDRDKTFDIDFHREHRSLNSNALFWKCVTMIAQAMNPPADKMDVYKMMLKRYGQYTYVCIKPEAVDMFKRTWENYEELGELEINGAKAIQFLAYFGSSTYDSKEFSKLLDGTISEMREMGLTPPPTKEMQRVIEMMEKEEERKKAKANNN